MSAQPLDHPIILGANAVGLIGAIAALEPVEEEPEDDTDPDE